MKLVNTVRLTGALLAGVVLSLFAGTASAAAVGTPTGTAITNLATVSYSVGGITQNPVGSSQTGNSSGAGTATQFLVDTKLALLVQTQDAAEVGVTPGQAAGAYLVFKVTNNGNSTVGVNFGTILQPTNTTDPFNATLKSDFVLTSVTAIVSKTNTTTYTPGAGNDTATSIPQLVSGGFNYVFIVNNAAISASQVDGDIAVATLEAFEANQGVNNTYGTAAGTTIATDNASAPWTQNPAVGSQQILFAELAGSDNLASKGFSTSRDAFLVKSAKLVIAKTVSVVSDPSGDATPHAIPGAVMKYTITVTNSGSTAATGITLADSIAAMVTAPTAYLAYKAGTITLQDPNVNGGAQLTCADGGSSGGSFGSDTCSFTSGTSTVNALVNTLTAGQVAIVTFQVTIQ